MNADLHEGSQPDGQPAVTALPEGIAAAMLLERAALVALRDPCLTLQERDVLERAVRVARSIQKRLPHDPMGTSMALPPDGQH